MTTDGHDSYPRAIRETPGPDVQHGASWYLNNRIEQDHRGIKQRDSPMRGFGSSRLRCPRPPEYHLALLCLSRRHIRVSFRLS